MGRMGGLKWAGGVYENYGVLVWEGRRKVSLEGRMGKADVARYGDGCHGAVPGGPRKTQTTELFNKHEPSEKKYLFRMM